MPPVKIPDSVSNYLPLEGKGSLTPIEIKFLGIHKNEQEIPYVTLKYYQPDYQCFSDWDKEDLKNFSAFVGKMRSADWETIFKSGGSLGNKKGFGCTYHKDKNKLPSCQTIDRISKDINFFELRVSKEARVHGFRVKDAFFLVWLDKDHDMCPM